MRTVAWLCPIVLGVHWLACQLTEGAVTPRESLDVFGSTLRWEWEHMAMKAWSESFAAYIHGAFVAGRLQDSVALDLEMARCLDTQVSVQEWSGLSEQEITGRILRRIVESDTPSTMRQFLLADPNAIVSYNFTEQVRAARQCPLLARGFCAGVDVVDALLASLGTRSSHFQSSNGEEGQADFKVFSAEARSVDIELGRTGLREWARRNLASQRAGVCRVLSFDWSAPHAPCDVIQKQAGIVDDEQAGSAQLTFCRASADSCLFKFAIEGNDSAKPIASAVDVPKGAEYVYKHAHDNKAATYYVGDNCQLTPEDQAECTFFDHASGNVLHASNSSSYVFLDSRGTQFKTDTSCQARVLRCPRHGGLFTRSQVTGPKTSDWTPGSLVFEDGARRKFVGMLGPLCQIVKGSLGAFGDVGSDGDIHTVGGGDTGWLPGVPSGTNPHLDQGKATCIASSRIQEEYFKKDLVVHKTGSIEKVLCIMGSAIPCGTRHHAIVVSRAVKAAVSHQNKTGQFKFEASEHTRIFRTDYEGLCSMKGVMCRVAEAHVNAVYVHAWKPEVYTVSLAHIHTGVQDTKSVLQNGGWGKLGEQKYNDLASLSVSPNVGDHAQNISGHESHLNVELIMGDSRAHDFLYALAHRILHIFRSFH